MKAKRQTTKPAPEPAGKRLRGLYRQSPRDWLRNTKAAPRRCTRAVDDLLAEISRRNPKSSGYILVGNVLAVADLIEHTAKTDPAKARKIEDQWSVMLMLTRLHRFARNNPRSTVIRRYFPKTVKALRGRA